jgi:myosin-5
LSEKKDFELSDYDQFHYLNQSGTGVIPGVDDAAEFETTQRALSTVGLSVQLQWKIFRLLAALLHIGNIKITGRGDAMLSEEDPALLTATRLLGIKSSDFRKWIVRKQIVTRSEKIVTNLSPVQAHVVKDSVAKYIYANLFDWLVSVTNESLSCSDPNNIATFIGVLDIYGFEHFKKNSFEQFCINYANEKLQQQFNQHVFKLEQEEYVREKINWTFIEFSDNQKCIELIEAKLGILSLLDEVLYFFHFLKQKIYNSTHRNPVYLLVLIKDLCKNCIPTLTILITKITLKNLVSLIALSLLLTMLLTFNMKRRVSLIKTRIQCLMNICHSYKMLNLTF